MGMPSSVGIIDTMIGFPHEGFRQYDFIRTQTKDRSSRKEMQFPAEYIFKVNCEAARRRDGTRNGMPEDRAR